MAARRPPMTSTRTAARVVNQQETIAAREKQQQLKDRFREWVWEDRERAARLAREYNDRFNNLRLRTFDGSHLTLPGMVREHLRDGDLGAIRRTPSGASCRAAARCWPTSSARARPGRWRPPPWNCAAWVWPKSRCSSCPIIWSSNGARSF